MTRAYSTNYIDATPVRAHIRNLYEEGFTDHRIALLASTSPQTIHAHGERPYPRNRGRQYRIHRDLAALILAINPETHRAGRISAEGTRRRLRALVAVGWPINEIGRRADISAHNTDRIFRRPILTVSTVEAIATTYDNLRNVKPERAGVNPTSAKRARLHAQKRRWAPPAYWDHPDHPIDDPYFEPQYGVTRAEILAEEGRWLMANAGLTKSEVALRLGVSRFYIDRALREYEQKAAA